MMCVCVTKELSNEYTYMKPLPIDLTQVMTRRGISL